ncbi:hypothetical protein A2U01_0016192 [Trifolium medium]|uniref:Transmembrane protein n=1 Tax=Trifolium medium TaxID=97028 RepID=A0A392N5Y5_9FABA|nr:hypothetical protein [Trifolium medium]
MDWPPQMLEHKKVLVVVVVVVVVAAVMKNLHHSCLSFGFSSFLVIPLQFVRWLGLRKSCWDFGVECESTMKLMCMGFDLMDFEEFVRIW